MPSTPFSGFGEISKTCRRKTAAQQQKKGADKIHGPSNYCKSQGRTILILQEKRPKL